MINIDLIDTYSVLQIHGKSDNIYDTLVVNDKMMSVRVFTYKLPPIDC